MKPINFKLKRKEKESNNGSNDNSNYDKKKKLIKFLIIFSILGIILSLVGFITNCLWFNDLGYSSVFWKKIITELEIRSLIFIVTALLTRLYLKSLKKG